MVASSPHPRVYSWSALLSTPIFSRQFLAFKVTGGSMWLLESCAARTHGDAFFHLSTVKAERRLYLRMLPLEKL